MSSLLDVEEYRLDKKIPVKSTRSRKNLPLKKWVVFDEVEMAISTIAHLPINKASRKYTHNKRRYYEVVWERTSENIVILEYAAAQLKKDVFADVRLGTFSDDLILTFTFSKKFMSETVQFYMELFDEKNL